MINSLMCSSERASDEVNGQKNSTKTKQKSESFWAKAKQMMSERRREREK